MRPLDKPLLLLSGLATVGVLGVVASREATPPYTRYQDEFARLVEERLGEGRAEGVPRGIQQIFVRPAHRVDRCPTCHLGVSWKGLEDAPEPFRTHPPGPLKQHPVEEFGCTFCHGGQGYATELPAAHGWVKHWEDPLLDSKLSAQYELEGPWDFLQVKCNECHRYDRKTAGAERINRAKDIVASKGCRACHTINGRGGSIGPDLTRVGDKEPQQYDYSRLTTFPSVFSWQVGHLQSPKSYSPGTVMPDFGFSTSDARSLALLLASWREVHIPAELRPGAVLRDLPTPEEAAREKMMLEGEGRFFVQKTCFICHDVSSLGIESATKIGPDLALAEEDAPRRFGVPLEQFLMNPTGTMAVVLSKQIILTPEERQEAIRLLKYAHRKLKGQAPQKGVAP